jgi:hypothetical protein
VRSRGLCKCYYIPNGSRVVVVACVGLSVEGVESVGGTAVAADIITF